MTSDPTNRLNRITRDPAFWVILPLTLVILPHFPRLPLWMPVLILSLFGIRLAAIVQPKILPRKFWLNLLAITILTASVLHYGTLLGKAAGTAVLVCLLGAKLLESHKTADYMLLIALSFFVIVTNFLFNQNIPTALYMLFTVVILVMTLISLHQGDAGLDIGWRFRAALKLVAKALPLMLIMFVLFPRVPGSLWHLRDDSAARSGLSNDMSPGNIAQLIQSDAVAFRVEFEKEKPAQEKLYWRALVLWDFDGTTWTQGGPNQNPRPTLEGYGEPVNYTITLEPHDKRWLFALDMPAAAPANNLYLNDFVLRSRHNITSLYRYTLQSWPDYRIEYEIARWEKRAGLALPADRNPRAVQMARQWRAEGISDEELLVRARNHFNQEDFYYTLQPPLTLSENPVDEFLFQTRRGFCEHYAGSFTLLMRAAGIPARVVLGYQGGTVNPLNGVLTVRQRDAHAWSEVWLENRGWVRIDPTAAIAPERIERNLDAALSADEIRPLYMQIDNSVLQHIRFYWDAMDNRWKQWIIGYGPKLQQQFMQKLFNRDLRHTELALLLVSSISVLGLVLAWLSFRKRPAVERDPAQRLYNRYCERLSRRGLTREPGEGPMDFAQRAMATWPTQRHSIELITRIYISSRYRSRDMRPQLKKMRQLIRKLQLRAESGT